MAILDPKTPTVELAHTQTVEEVLARCQSSPQGISADEVRTRLGIYGPNQLPAPPRQGALLRFLMQFHNVLIYVLLGCAFVTALLQHWIDTAVILAVVVINALLGFIGQGGKGHGRSTSDAGADGLGHTQWRASVGTR